MTITEEKFQAAIKYGGIALAVCLAANFYLVLKYREAYRDKGAADRRFEQLILEQQSIEEILRACIAQAETDPPLAEILRRHQLIGGPPAAGQGPKP
jgi:hypothetical protein